MKAEDIKIGQTVYYLKENQVKSFIVKGIMEGASDWHICEVATSTQKIYTRLGDCYPDLNSTKLALVDQLGEKIKGLTNDIKKLFDQSNEYEELIEKIRKELY